MRFLIVILFYMFAQSAFCATPVPQILNTEEVTFDVKDANKQFHHIQSILLSQNPSIKTYRTAIKNLAILITQADQCVLTAEKRLKNLDALIKNISQPVNQTSADFVYLTKEQKKIADKQAQCRLFSIRGKEARESYITAMTELKQEEAFTRGRPLWSLITVLFKEPTTHSLITLEPMSIPSLMTMPSVMTSWIVVSMLLSMLMLFSMAQGKFFSSIIRIKTIRLRHVMLLTCMIFLGGLTIYSTIFYWQNPTSNQWVLDLVVSIFCYVVGIVLVSIVFNFTHTHRLFSQYPLNRRFLFSLTVCVLGFVIVGVAAKPIGHDLLIQHRLQLLIVSCFVLTILLASIYYLDYFCRVHARRMIFIKKYHSWIRWIGIGFFLGMAILNILGYRSLTTHLTFASLTTIAIIFVATLLVQMVSRFYVQMSEPGALHTCIIKIFGYKPAQTLVELMILKMTIQLFIVIMASYFITQSFGYATHFIEKAYTQLLYGVHIGSFTFYPTRIFASIIIFCVLYLLFRSFATSMSRQDSVEEEEDTQVVIASILIYIGFACALMAALFVAGFDFTGLAIVAGALSVGIGLGLQSIVNNFVSGIILLIEKPIKPGDRISVDGVEGTVKKISVRSTQITTPSHEDIIIPNSNLMTHRVINYTFSDKHLVIHCDVGVAHGSDTALVKDLLLSVTHNHEDVIQSARHKPSVLFRAFGENALLFQLNVLIKDGKKKAKVQSELNFAIERVFREHKIHLALPQRDVHVTLLS